ncbi:MAG: aminoacyl-tRNA hydrolase [Planctomycetota bacterium]|nr:MAG: aminoacyl-tRNA hydrolase [Planctomycetota bacterium]
MKIVLGIGNPGREYQGTRHNVGYMVIDVLARRSGVSGGKSRFRAITAEVRIAQEKVILVKPVTYVNLSGLAAAAALSYYDLDLEDFLVICDDMNLVPGKIRLRRGGASGGHNGLKSIAEAVHTDEFPRLRIGIGPPPGNGANHVLSRFRGDEADLMDRAVQTAADAVETWAAEGMEAAMNKFNAPLSADEQA